MFAGLINGTIQFLRSLMGKDRRWTITVPKEKFEQLKSDPEFCATLALGRAVNALHFVHTPLLDAQDGTPRATRDRFNSLLFTCALFAEAILLVEKLEEKYFLNHPEFQQVRNIIGSAETKALRKQLFIVRDKLVFHFDPKQVQEQMADIDLEYDPIIVSGLGKQKMNTYQELIDLVALRSFFGSSFPKDIAKMKPSLQAVSHLVVSFLEAAEEFMVAMINKRGWAEMNFLP